MFTILVAGVKQALRERRCRIRYCVMAGGQAGEAQRDFQSELIIQDEKLKPKASVVESPEDLRHRKI